jgi:uncharacterized SAM-dependent methyltransferase
MVKVLAALVASLAFCTTLASAADAADRLVSTSGTDSGNCTVTDCATVQYAVDQAITGDTVLIGTGSFVGNVNVNK